MDCCTEHARASAGLPAIEPGMPEPAGTGLSRRSLLLRGVGLGLAVYGAGKLAQLPAFETGVAAAQGAGPNTVLLSVFMDGGVDSLSLLAPVGDPQYRKLRPKLAVGGRARVRRGPAPALAPGGERAGRPARRGQGLRPARGRLHRRRPVALHVAPLLGGRRARRQPALGLARPHARRRRLARQPAPGRLARRAARAVAGDRAQPGRRRSTSPRTSASGRRAPGGRRRSWPCRRSPSIGRSLTGARATRRWRRPRGRRRSRAASATRWRRSASTASPPTRPRPPTRRAPRPSRSGSPASPRCSPPGLPIRAAAIRAPGGYDTHANQEESLGKNLKLTFDSLLAFQRDLEARGLADRVLTLVWSEFGRRAQENGSGTDHGAAGCGFIVGTRAAGRMIGEFPGLGEAGQGRQPARDRRTSAASTARWRGDWFGVDPAAVLPDARGIGRPVILK